MPPKTPSRTASTRAASARLSRQSSVASDFNGHANDDVDEKKPVVDMKPVNGTPKHSLSKSPFSDNVTFATPKTVTSKGTLKPPSRTRSKPKPKAKVRPSILSVLLRLSFLSLAAYTFLCPLTPTTPDQPITGPCTLLSRAHTDVYNPFIAPHVESAWSAVSSHPQVGPYTAHVENAFNYVTPYITSARSSARAHLIPVIEKAQGVSGQAYNYAYGVAKPYVDPYAAQISEALDPYWKQGLELHREHVSPRFLALRAQTQHAIHAAAPYAFRARVALLQAYDKIKPHAYNAWVQSKVLAKKVGAAIPLGVWFEEYIKPLWEKLMNQVGHITDDAGQQASPFVDQAQSTLAVVSESAASAAAAAQTGAVSMASVAQSQAAGFAAAARESVLAAASVVQSVASEYVSVVQDKLSSISSAAQATRTSVTASAASASHKVSDVVADAASAASASAEDYASHASSVVSTASEKATAAVVDAASTVSESATSVAAQGTDAARSASAVVSGYVASALSAASASAEAVASSASSAVSHATEAAANVVESLEDSGVEASAQVHFKAASLAEAAYSKAASVAATASEAAAAAQATAADLAASASANVEDAAASASASLASLAAAYQSQAALVAALAQSSAAAASESLAAKLEDAREAVGIHEASAEDAAAEAASLLEKGTPLEPVAEPEDQEAENDFESWFASLLTEEGPKDVGTETVLPPSPVEEAEVPAEIPADTSRTKYVRPSDEEIAEKRREIEASHNRWEEMLHAIGQGAVERLERTIERVRKASGEKLLGENGGEWGKDVAAYEKEVGRVVEGVERYATKLHTEDRPASEKTQMLRDVVAKVRVQVERWAGDVEEKLRMWWTGSEAGILADVEKAERDVLDIANEAQNDLGMKYAWLEDVTAKDWTRYHALVDDAAAYGKKYRDLMYLTEETPLYKALADLTAHIQDVLLGFEARLALIDPFADAPVSGAEDKDALVSPDIAEEAPQMPLFIPGAAAQEVGADGILQRSKEEVERALHDAQAAAGDILDDAESTWHSATREASKAVGATPTPETVEEYYDFAKAQAGEKAQEAYEQASSVVHDATRSVIKAAGGTPSPETFHEHVDYVVAKAQESVESASSVIESAYGAATSNVYENIHHATRSVIKAAGGSPAPETPEEYYDFAMAQAQAAYGVVGDAAHEATRSIIKAAGYTPTPENLSEHASSLAARATEGVEAMYGSASSGAASLADSVPSGEEVQARVEEILSSASAAIEEVAGEATNLAESIFDAGSSALHQATRSVIRAAGATPTPETFGEHVESVVDAASEGIHQATRSIIKAAGGTPEPENLQEHYESVVARASEAVVGAEAVAGEIVDSLYSSAHSATRSVLKAMGATPTPENFAETVESLSARAADSAGSVAAVIDSLASEAGESVASATESAKSMAGVDSAKPLTERAASSAHSVLDYLASEADDTFTKATDSVKSAAGVETAKPAMERVSSSVASVASSISSYIHHEEL